MVGSVPVGEAAVDPTTRARATARPPRASTEAKAGHAAGEKAGRAEGEKEPRQLLEAAGCELVRVALPSAEDAGAFGEVVLQSPVPIIADIHFDWRLALTAIDRGAQGIRINPGTIAEKHVRDVVRAAAEARVSGAGGAPPVPVAIRVGVNSGSLPRRLRDLAENKDVNKFNRLLEALASQSGNLLNISELSNTCGLARDTIERYRI